VSVKAATVLFHESVRNKANGLCDNLEPEADINCMRIFHDTLSIILDLENNFRFHFRAIFIVPVDEVFLIQEVLGFDFTVCG
jgi:hypothetical protein